MPAIYVALLAAVLLLLGGPVAAAAQSSLVRPHLDWRTVRTEHFDVHFPAPMAEWTLTMARRLDALHDAVSSFVGYEPQQRITVIVEDPLNQSNGFASAPLDAPLIVLWPTPPDPSGMLGTHRGWGELLAVHEYAHIAHLIRPTRNPRERWFWKLLPIRFGPVGRKAPRWVVEGYATHVEGRLTGSGRPHGAARPAYLRQWALEGRLPTYGQLSGGSDFAAGAMAYLAGSAFLEWLVEQKGESSLVAVWRRMSARQDRSFTQAFAGIFGAPPDELYGQFTVETTRLALLARDTLQTAGLAAGTLVQRRRWATGEPAVRHDGRRIAISLPNRVTPGPLVVWRTEERVDTARVRRARERALALDPQDVITPPFEPPPKAAVATLRPRGGRGFHSPRFFRDTVRLLVAHDEALGDGGIRTDLYEWNYRAGSLRRITYGAGVRDADPLPDGRTAVAVRCANGTCDLVRVDLASGDTHVIRRGSAEAAFHRPRVSPDGRTVVVSVQDEGRWRLAIVALDAAADLVAAGVTSPNGVMRFVDPDDGASRYDATFLPGGGALLAVSERGGIPNLERIDLLTGETRTLTRVTSAVASPEPNPLDGSIYFLQLHARGLDLRRLAPDSVARGPAVALGAALTPVAPVPPVPADTFLARPLPPARPYGIGPRRHRLLPGGNVSAEGALASLTLVGADPVGRLGYMLHAGGGERSAWRGAALAAAWRGTRALVGGTMVVDGTVAYAEQRPSRQRLLRDLGGAPPRFLDADHAAASLGTTTARDFGSARLQFRLGGSLGAVRSAASVSAVEEPSAGGWASRALAYADGRAAARLRRGLYILDLGLGGYAARGATDGAGWARAAVSVIADGRTPFGGLRLEGSLGATGRDVPFEHFVLGGWPSPFIDPAALSQRIAMPALPAGYAVGRRIASLRVSSGFGPFRPYYWVGNAAEALERWKRVAGVDVDYAIGAHPGLAIPAVTLRAGAAYSFDAPFRDRASLFAGITYRP